MTRSNRVLNRILILLVGVVAIVTGLAVALPAFAVNLGVSVPKFTAPHSDQLWISLGACLVIIVLSLIWIFTRGRGRTSVLLARTDDQGSITIDVHVAADLVAEALSDNRDVASVGSGAYLMRNERVLSLRLVTKRGADLPALISAVNEVIGEFDSLIESRIPVLLQVVSELGSRTIRTR
jgi:hypothetical protein